MAKEIELNISITKDGEVLIEPKGTEGKECLDIMKFLDKINGIEVKSTVPNNDMNKKNYKQNTIDIKSN